MSRGPSPFRVVILTGWDSPSTREAIMSVVGVPGVKVAAVIYDRGAAVARAGLTSPGAFWMPRAARASGSFPALLTP